MSRSRRRVVGALVALALVTQGGAPAEAQPAPTDPVAPHDLSPAGDPLAPDGAPVDGTKATSSTLAETDPDLLARTDGAVVPVMIKLDYDAIAVYRGGREGLAPTSPEVTGEPLTEADTTTGPYARQVARDEAAIVADITAAVPEAEIGRSLRTVYGGVAARLPAEAVEDVLAVDGVVAVQADSLEQLLTDATPSFIGADEVWAQVGGQADAGAGTIFGSLDSGVWPEHPSLADDGTRTPAPAKADGTPRTCAYGDNPLTPATDVFACNDKLIGGEAFMDTYDALVGDDLYTGLARDSNGHGTHTATTAAGNPVASAPIFGIERGPVSGIAPGAWVSAYKVCGPGGCYGSDSVAAVAQAILDGVDVINYSISGGNDPATDAVELAFLDAYAAGVFVSASAGNDGPGAGTVNHRGPWTTTVAATSPNRDLASTLTVSGGAGLTLDGRSLTAGITTPLPIVLASAPPYNSPTCTVPAPPGLFTGKIVACERGPGRVTKGFNVRQGGAAGMVLYNATPSNVSAENHWLPTIHVGDGAGLVAHLAANPGATASFTAGAATPATGDEMAPFSSRGPGGLVIKPDVGAPGQQVIAGTTPTPESPSEGPAGEYFRGLDGTSMAAPHVAGAALLLRDAHPDWSPGQIRSALAGTAVPVTDGGSPADVFDTGSGRIQVDAAAAPGLILDETADRYADLGTDPVAAVHLNLPQVNAPSVPGRLRTTRTVTNPGAPATYAVSTTVGAGSAITVAPAGFTLGTGESQVLEITIDTTAAIGSQQQGLITVTAPGRNGTRLPVAFVPQPSEVSLTALGCTPDPVTVPQTSTCSYELANQGYADALVDLRAEGDGHATVTGADLGATTAGGVAAVDDVALDGTTRAAPHTAPGPSVAGYLPLDAFGITPTAIGDEQYLPYTVPAFVYGGQTYTRIAITSNGYLVVGDATAQDVQCCPLTAIGDPARPNNILAPFWTDLDGTGRPGIYIGVLTDGIDDWIVVEWRVNLYGTSSPRVFQAWIGVNGSEDISFAYDPSALPAAPPAGYSLLVGAENVDGAGTSTLAPGTAPTGDMRVVSGDEVPSGTVQWDVTVRGTAAGTAAVEAEATSNAHPGTVVATNELVVEAEPAPVVTDDPDDLEVDALETATFTAAATGGTLARWERRADGDASWATVPGATSTTLSFTAHGGDDQAQYRAVFANTSGDEATTEPATLTVDLLATTTAVSVSPATPVRGQDVTFTADVGPATATGTVQFTLDGNAVGGPVAVAGGSAVSSAVPDIAAGSHTVVATYSGDADHLGSDDDADFTVTRTTSTTTIVEITAGVIGEDTPVDATITVVPAPAGGTVALTVDGTPYGAPLTLDASGSVEATLTGLAPGSRTIVARFSGDDDLDPSEDEATITVYAAGEAFVRRAYQVMLGRNGDASGIAYWTGRIDAGMSRTALIDLLAGSAEGRNRLVGRLFLTALDRPASAADRAYWSGRVAAGMTAEDLLVTLLTSPEALAGQDSLSFTRKLFDVHLVRTPGAAELVYWSDRVAATLNVGQLRQLSRQLGRLPEPTQVALTEAARLTCGTTAFPPGIADQLRARWVAHGRHPVRLAGDTLALLCPSSSAPPV
ncbi:MAG TPA: S8 family serine peptidase [Iamia sp.]|nr:S8 family serine peptidase [Iamia sp.]